MSQPTEPKSNGDPKTLLQQQIDMAGLQKAAADARKAQADAEKAALDAQKAAIDAAIPSVPKGETKPLAGDITTSDTSGYIAGLVAYQAMKESAQAIGKVINDCHLTGKGGPARILIVPKRDFATGDFPLLQIDKQLALLADVLDGQVQKNKGLLPEPESEQDSYEDLPELESYAIPLVPAVISAAVTAAPAIASTLGDLAGYFKSDYNFKGQTVQLDMEALSAVVAGAIERHPVYLFNFNLLDDSEVVERISQLIGKRREVETSRALLNALVIEPANAEITRLAEEIAKQKEALAGMDKERQAEAADAEAADAEAAGAETAVAIAGELRDNQADLTAAQKQRDQASLAVMESDNLVKTLGEFLDAITRAPDEKTPPLFVQAAIRQHIRKQGITHILHLSILSSGGEAVTRKRLFASGELAYNGGSAIAYVLAATDGQVVKADTQVALAQLDFNLSAPEKVVFRKIHLGR